MMLRCIPFLQAPLRADPATRRGPREGKYQRMQHALLSFVAALAITCDLASAAFAAGVTICNGTSRTVGFALGYVGAKSLESAGPFESQPGKCATFLTEISKGPFYVFGVDPTGAMSWTAQDDKTAQAFCLSDEPHFISRNDDYMKSGKLVCPDHPASQFILVPDEPPEGPKFTFTKDNADRP